MSDAPTGKRDDLMESVRALFGRELEIEHELGRGGMAVVYSAHDAALQRRVAVKVLVPEYAADEAMAARFLREARTVAALQHPHVVSVYGVRSNGELSAIVMQFVEGRSLDVLLAEKPQLATPVAGLLLSQAAAGLQHAHERGIIHRDVKPANVLIDRDGRAVVSDFGIALHAGATRLTDTGMVVGTMAYMSPEQRSGGVVGPAADQYALGVMAFELFAGRLPFTGALPQMVAQHMHDPPPPLGTLRPELASFVVNTVMRMLEKKPEARFKDLREAERVFRMLAPAERGTTRILAAMSSVGAVAQSSVRAAVPPDVRQLPDDVRAPVMRRKSSAQRLRLRLRPFAIAALALGIVGAGTLAWQRIRNKATASRQRPRPLATTNGAATSVGNGAANGAPRATKPAAAVSRPTKVARGPDAARAPSTVAAIASPPNVTSGSAPAVPPPVSSAIPTTPAAPVPLATVAEARVTARQFVALLNQHRWSELEQLEPMTGDAALRTELLRLTRSAPAFAAGFDRVASVPTVTADAFTTDFVLDLEWRGGRRIMTVRIRAVPQGVTWRLVAFGVSARE